MRRMWNKFKRCCRKVWEATRPARQWIAKVARKCAEAIAEELSRQFAEDAWDWVAA